MRIIGIDPGVTGGLAWTDGRDWRCFRMPVENTGKGNRKAVVPSALATMRDKNTADYVVIEAQQAFPKQGGVSNFSNGLNYGLVLGAFVFDRVVVVRPQAWKKALGVVGTGREGKQAALVVARRLWPGVAAAWAKCDGVIDALLIAEYGRRTLQPPVDDLPY